MVPANNPPRLHVCLVCVEMFGVGVYGGFGRATRILGRELSRRGLRVSAIVPHRTQNRNSRYELDGLQVYEFAPGNPWAVMRLCRALRADIYHSQDPSLTTYLALRAAPRKKHIVTLRDPLDRRDWKIETALSGKGYLGWRMYRTFVDNPLVCQAVRRADACYCAAQFLSRKGARKYRLTRAPRFLPTPVALPERPIKASQPTVCFIGRWEPRKRPELFFALARALPQIRFIAVGGAQDEKRDRFLRSSAGEIANLELTGFVDQFRTDKLDQVLSQSWVLVNTSAREGLPTTFIEAAAYGCAIVSFTDPDGFASRFGVHVSEHGGATVAALRSGLEQILRNDVWRERGRQAREFVSAVFGLDVAIQAHVTAYHQLFESDECPGRVR